MPFLVPVLAAIGGGSAVAGGLAVAGTAASVYSSVSQANAAKKAGAASGQGVDIASIDQQTRDIAKQNALDSAALEKQLTPEVPQLRTAANTAVLNDIGGTQTQRDAAGVLAGNLNKTASDPFANTPLLKAAIEKARSDLALGGKLSLDQQNEATRQGGVDAATVGGGGLGLGRDLAGRDLGLKSYQIEQQRLNTALQAGGLESNQTQFNAQNFLNQYGALNSYYNNLRTQDLQAAAFGNSIPSPVVGLDPSSVANIATGNQNAQNQAAINSANIKAQQGQNLMGFGGQLLGYAASNYGKTPAASTPNYSTAYLND